MAFRRLVVLALAVLLPAVAFADNHPLECLAGYSSKADTTEDEREGDDSESTLLRANCTWLVGAGESYIAAPTEVGVSSGVRLFPAASIVVQRSEGPEALFGGIAYLRKWGQVHPFLRVLPLGFTTAGDVLRPAAVVGLGADVRSPCRRGENFWKTVCSYLGARVDFDAVYLRTKPRELYGRFAAGVGVRWERGAHPKH